jgi:hypothetical protein
MTPREFDAAAKAFLPPDAVTPNRSELMALMHDHPDR